MALDTLKHLKQIGGFEITRGKPSEISWDEFDRARERFPIHITDDKNMISFKIQAGPIKEFGVNGCQVDTLIEAAMIMIDGLNRSFPCDENIMVLAKLESALRWLEIRKDNREKRGVEGLSKE